MVLLESTLGRVLGAIWEGAKGREAGGGTGLGGGGDGSTGVEKVLAREVKCDGNQEER